jgi:PAS domain S-box-containing protein
VSTSNRDAAFLAHAGVIGEQIARQDWSAHPLGPIDGWPPALRTALSMVLASGFPSLIAWTDRFHVLYNAGYQALLGERANIGQGTSLGDLWPEIADSALAIAARAFAGESVSVADMPFVLMRQGQPHHLYFTFSYSPIRDDAGAVCGILGTVIETTDRVMAIARYQETEEQYRLSIEAGRMGTWSVDPDTGVTVMDDRFASLFGVPVDVAQRGAELDRFTAMIHPDDRAPVIAAVTHAIATDTPYEIDYRTVPRSGQVFWVTAKGKMFTDAATGKRRFAGVAIDITERKQAQLALLEEAKRKDEFLAMLAHELRNPLAPISAAAALLRMRSFDERRVIVTSEVIGRQVDHMTHLIDDLLDVSRVTRGLVTLDMHPLELGAIVADAVEQVTPAIRARQQRISVQLATDSAIVCADRKRLVQVLANVLNNAAKYTPEGGNIVLATTVTARHVEIDITDDGIGMEPDFADRAFDLFTQAERTSDRASGGLGLGLALVKSLVELHHGSVKAASAGIGKGSTFTLCLPRIQEPAAAPGSAGPGATAADAAPLHIMVVDDNRDAALMLSMLLEAVGHRVTVDYSSTAALAHACEVKPDVFLLDIGLPEMDGNALARRLRALPETAGALLVAVTGYGQDHDREATRASGFDHHLVKPLDTGHLLALLATVKR